MREDPLVSRCSVETGEGKHLLRPELRLKGAKYISFPWSVKTVAESCYEIRTRVGDWAGLARSVAGRAKSCIPRAEALAQSCALYAALEAPLFHLRVTSGLEFAGFGEAEFAFGEV